MPKSEPTAHDALSDLAAKLLEVFDEGVPAVIRDAASPFSTEMVFDWIRTVHTPASCGTGAKKIDAVKRSWGLSPSATDANAPDPGRPLELYRAGAVLLDPSPFVPSSAHQSFEDWVDQTRERLGPDFGAMAPNLECASWQALEHLQALLTPVLSRTGPRSFRYNAFLGDYRRTPFGYHLDPHQECVFQFVLHGTRTGRFWEGLILGEEDAAWIEDPNHRTKAPRRPDLEVELSPGDVVFWPGTHLHGFDTQGPSLALSLVIDRTSPQPRDQVVSSLQLATLGGQAALPPVDEGTNLDPTAPLRRRPHARLQFECHDDDLVVGVCGRTFVWPDRASQSDAMDLLRALQHTDGAIPDDLTRTFSSKALERDDILGLLSTLGELGYFAATG